MPCRRLALFWGLLTVAVTHGDEFDHYLNPHLTKLAGSDHVKEVPQLTPTLVGDFDRVLPNAEGAFLVVKTNGGRNAKLLVQAGRQKVGTDKFVPLFLVQRFVTYKEGEERTVLTSGGNLALFPGFRVSFDLGQIVPEEVGGDLRLALDEAGKPFVTPVDKARLFLVTKPLSDAAPKKGDKLVVGEKFETRYFNGSYRLFDDGRRSGTLRLEVDDEGYVSGALYSDKDGAKYEVRGRVGMPAHSIQFTVKFPRTEQEFRGMLFTGDGKALAGTSRMLEREAGFYAVRLEE
jgi:hypothetical protein